MATTELAIHQHIDYLLFCMFQNTKKSSRTIVTVRSSTPTRAMFLFFAVAETTSARWTDTITEPVSVLLGLKMSTNQRGALFAHVGQQPLRIDQELPAKFREHKLAYLLGLSNRHEPDDVHVYKRCMAEALDSFPSVVDFG